MDGKQERRGQSQPIWNCTRFFADGLFDLITLAWFSTLRPAKVVEHL
jgi:hypothetical protein